MKAIESKQYDNVEFTQGGCDVFIDLNMAKIRYYKQDGQLKNTLYTLSMGDRLVFGISRCNLKEDQFRKAEGRNLARERAVDAHKAYSERREMLIFAEDGLSGQVRGDLVNVVLDYFYNLESNESPQEAREKEIQNEVDKIMYQFTAHARSDRF